MINIYFRETPTFTKQIKELIDDDKYQALQEHLIGNPESGDVIKASGGLRKVRWSVDNKGKRGGIRVIYYYLNTDGLFYMLLAYKKGVQDDLSPAVRDCLRQLVEDMKDGND